MGNQSFPRRTPYPHPVGSAVPPAPFHIPDDAACLLAGLGIIAATLPYQGTREDNPPQADSLRVARPMTRQGPAANSATVASKASRPLPQPKGFRKGHSNVRTNKSAELLR